MMFKLTILIALATMLLSVTAGGNSNKSKSQSQSSENEKLSKKEKNAMKKFAQQDFNKQMKEKNEFAKRVQDTKFAVSKKHQSEKSLTAQDAPNPRVANKMTQEGSYTYVGFQYWDNSQGQGCHEGYEIYSMVEKSDLCFWDGSQYIRKACTPELTTTYLCGIDSSCTFALNGIYSDNNNECISLYGGDSMIHRCPNDGNEVPASEVLPPADYRYPVQVVYSTLADGEAAILEDAVEIYTMGKKAAEFKYFPGTRKCQMQKLDTTGNGQNNKKIWVKSLCVGKQTLEYRFYDSYKKCTKFGNRRKSYYYWTQGKGEGGFFNAEAVDDDDDDDDDVEVSVYYGPAGATPYHTHLCYGLHDEP